MAMDPSRSWDPGLDGGRRQRSRTQRGTAGLHVVDLEALLMICCDFDIPSGKLT